MFYGKFNPMEYTDKLDDFIRSKVTAYPDVFIIDTDVSCPQSNIPAFVDKLWGQKLVGSHQLSISFSTKLKKKKKKTDRDSGSRCLQTRRPVALHRSLG